MLVSEEEHESYRVVQLVHLLEIWYLIEVTNIDDGEVLDTVSDSFRAVSVLGSRLTTEERTNDIELHPDAYSPGRSRAQTESPQAALLRT